MQVSILFGESNDCGVTFGSSMLSPDDYEATIMKIFKVETFIYGQLDH